MTKACWKALWLIPAVVAAALIAHRCKPKMGGLCVRMFEAMPEDIPPKEMHRNILAIREQTERILALLEGQAQSRG